MIIFNIFILIMLFRESHQIRIHLFCLKSKNQQNSVREEEENENQANEDDDDEEENDDDPTEQYENIEIGN